MRNNENNIIFNVRNITLNLKNITTYFTGKGKIITLVLIIIMLSFVNITLYSSNMFSNTNVSALSYSSNVGVGFTFNPTLSVSLSSSDLVIPNLFPGSTLDSNSINISVATNASYGYTLSATVGDSTHDNSNLTHSNNIDIFSSIDTDSSLPSLTTDNTWGYSYRLSNNSNSNAWSNYSGLSNETSKTLVDSNDQTAIPIDFKIAAKASETQPSGAYTGTINFAAVTKPTPMNLSESYFAAGKTRHNGYYAMQDMTSEICNNTEVIGEGSQTQLIDLRDDKVYWATKLADGHCWMTQNLGLNLSHDRPLTSEDTDLNNVTGTAYQDGYGINDDIIYWTPATTANTINFEGTNVPNWRDSNSEPYSANKMDGPQNSHISSGNYYNWPAAVASNDVSVFPNNTNNSICQKAWRLPTGNEFEIVSSTQGSLQNITNGPTYFLESGNINGYYVANNAYGFYWKSSVYNLGGSFEGGSFGFSIAYNYKSSDRHDYNRFGFSVRCLAR